VSAVMHQPHVMAIVGSPRSNGNTSYLVDVAIEELERHGVRCEKILIADYRVLPCEGHDECEEFSACPLDDDAGPLLDKMYAAEGLILASPVYYEDVSGQMKLFIDRNCFNNYHEIWLKAKSIGLIAVAESTGLDETIDSLRRFVSLSSNSRAKPLSASGFAHRVGDAAENDSLVAAVKQMAHEMATTLVDAGTDKSRRHGV